MFRLMDAKHDESSSTRSMNPIDPDTMTILYSCTTLKALSFKYHHRALSIHSILKYHSLQSTGYSASSPSSFCVYNLSFSNEAFFFHSSTKIARTWLKKCSVLQALGLHLLHLSGCIQAWTCLGCNHGLVWTQLLLVFYRLIEEKSVWWLIPLKKEN